MYLRGERARKGAHLEIPLHRRRGDFSERGTPIPVQRVSPKELKELRGGTASKSLKKHNGGGGDAKIRSNCGGPKPAPRPEELHFD